jgi:hypothetical protein
MKIPENEINFLVDKYHVLTSIEIIENDLLKRMKNAKNKVKASTQKQVIKYARKRHENNFIIYSNIMKGNR